MTLPILFKDDHLVVINKPAGLLVHRSLLDKGETVFALQLLRDQLGQYVYPVHRLDKPTSGLLVFALSESAAQGMSDLFQMGNVEKTYESLVRGFFKSQVIDHPLREQLDRKADILARKNKPAQTALTMTEKIQHFEIPKQVDKFPTSRYSLVKAIPKTGRKHQIRRHLRHVGHPIVGDITHGVGVHNRFFRQEFGVHKLLLSCVGLKFNHPMTGVNLNLECARDLDFSKLLKNLDHFKI